MWSRALQLDVESDATYVLMDPLDVGDDGEWAVYCHEVRAAGPPRRYESFRAYMEDMYRQFHRLRAAPGPEAGFVNATTRALDAVVEDAWHWALAGEYERARAALTEPDAFGRPRATALVTQIDYVLGKTSSINSSWGMSDAVREREFLPVPKPVAGGHRRRDPYALLIGPWRRKPSFSYVTPGGFGAAVDEAREQARWGDADAAWYTIRAALPQWQPLDATHLAPFGLLEDSILGPLMTGERRREFLSVPRGPHAVPGPGPIARTPTPDGLAWLAEGTVRSLESGYRFVLVEGVGPAELPGLIGADEEADEESVLLEPSTSWEAHHFLAPRRDETPWYDDKPLMAVGRAGPGWSFAFDGHERGFSASRFVSPAAAASRATRAVVVWCSRDEFPGPPVFHLSVAEEGVERYAFTAYEADVVRSGSIPPPLEPGRFFSRTGDRAGWLVGERRALEAVATAFGVSLPRFALSEDCRLHRFRTRSWTRLPGSGVMYDDGSAP
ncbi:cell wall assembly protein [Streptomyces mashuensis]|uniref:Cell wall assembly protein n=2 Tax=Streptomyces mashuensis TaxID=33904 RepID=A0A919B8S5_9ACTN|nr:SMI1/KNR4 family protein [Streptomyces mashuensis]GHF65845.1 cell wall assembly protein [Streptomyces mashuensis]